MRSDRQACTRSRTRPAPTETRPNLAAPIWTSQTLAGDVTQPPDLPEGGTTRTYYATVHDPDCPWDFVYRTTAEAALHTARVWGRTAFAAVRDETTWPDGTTLTGPWREVTNAATTTPVPQGQSDGR